MIGFPRKKTIYIRFGKRIFDLALVVPALYFFLPVMAIVALMIRWKLGRPVIYSQERAGLQGRPFNIYKFRTMLELFNDRGDALRDEDRLTSFGDFLRSTSLDELPELFNVIKGEMSMVGPRPLFMKYLPLYNPEQALRHVLKPGISGLAQVNGRNSLSWEEKFSFDFEYVHTLSFWRDCAILLKTIQSSVKREGIRQPGQATAAEFIGSMPRQ